MAATDEARRPRTRPSASTTYQVRWISVTFGENVRTRPIFRFRVVGEPSLRRLPRERAQGSRGSREPTYQDRAPGQGGQAAALSRTGPAAGPRPRAPHPRSPPRPGTARGPAPVGHAVAGGRPQPLQQAGRVLPAPAHLDQAGHERAHHLVAEGVGARSRSAAAARPRGSASAVAVGVAASGPSSTLQRARVTRRTIGSAGVGPRRAAAERAEVVAARAARRRRCAWSRGRAGRARARRSGPAAGRARARSTPGSGRCGRWPSGGRRSRRRPRSARRTTTSGASWRLRARARPAPVVGDGRAGRRGRPGPGRARRRRCGRRR